MVTTCLGKSLRWNNYLLKCRQVVWENHSSGTSSPDKKTACLGNSLKRNKFADKETAYLRNSIKRINYHPTSPPVIYSQMSINSTEGTEKCIVYKLRSLLVKIFNHDTTAPRFNPKFEVWKPYWVKKKLVSIGIVSITKKPCFYHYSINSVIL